MAARDDDAGHWFEVEPLDEAELDEADLDEDDFADLADDGASYTGPIDTRPPYDPDAVEDAIRHANPRALMSIVRDALSRAGTAHGLAQAWKTIVQVEQAARAIAAGQRSKHETQLQRITNRYRMSHTEVCLRLASYLVTRDMVTSPVRIRMSRREITRFREPYFNIEGFMKAKGGTLVQAGRSPFGLYSLPGAAQGIELHGSPAMASVVADVGPGSRLIVHAFAGPTSDTSSSIEHTLVRQALGTALTHYAVGEGDLLAVALPRSPRFRRLVGEALASPRVAATGISMITVGAHDQIDGIPLPGPYVPPGFPGV